MPIAMKHLFCIWFLSCSLGGWAQVSGICLLDRRGSDRATLAEPVSFSMSIKAYSTAGGLLTQTTSAADGRFELTIPPGQAVRLEFGNLPHGWAYSSDSKQVRFVQTPVHLNQWIHKPAERLGTSPRLAQTVYVSGDYSDSSSDSLAAVVLTTADASGPALLHRIASPRQVGSLWGLAYDRASGFLYGSALAKRHAGFGPLGSGGIYRLTPAKGQVEPWINLDALGFPTRPPGLTRDLTGPVTSISHDSLLFSLVGKSSLGGLDISEDGRTLYVMNLYDRALYAIEIPAEGHQPQPSDVRIYRLPISDQSSGQFRPFAVKVYQNQVYVGVVNDAAKSDLATDLKASVYVLDPAPDKHSFSEVFSCPLNYSRGILDYGISGWRPWTDDYRKTSVPTVPEWLIYPQPILADIEFGADGSMSLGLMDRLGHQTGDGQLFRPTAQSPLIPYRGLAGGDVLRANLRNGRYILEQNGRAGLAMSGGKGNKQGPGGGEFYADDQFQADGIIWHQETATGGLASLPGSQQLVVAAREPASGQYVTGGIRWFDHQTGNLLQGRSLLPGGAQAGYFRKSNNVGDVEVVADPMPIQSGNRVWHDQNENGQQDADEPGLPGVQVLLFQQGKPISQTQTDASGYYLFDQHDVAGGLQPNTAYTIHIPFQQPQLGQLSLPTPTKRNPASSLPQLIDNDAFIAGDAAIVGLITGRSGQILHGLDAGLTCPNCSESLRPSADPLRLTITPNPVQQEAILTYQGYESRRPLTITLVDIQGKPVFETRGSLSDNQYRTVINLTGFAPGHYLLTVQEGEHTTTGRLVKL